MSLPIINYKATNTELRPDLQELLEVKLSSLERFIGDETDVNCDVEFEQVAPRQNGEIYRVEVNLWLKGTLHRAESTGEQFEKSIDEVRDELDKELRRSHKRHHSLVRRGGRRLKEMMQFGR